MLKENNQAPLSIKLIDEKGQETSLEKLLGKKF